MSIAGGFTVSDYTLTNKALKDIESDLKDFDVIHLNGGNSFYLLLQILKSKFDTWIKNQIKNGKIFIGSSAGAIVASPDISIAKKIDTNTFVTELKEFSKKGIGIVDFIILPHWGSKDFREVSLNQRLDVAYKEENKIILLNDYQFINTDGSNLNFIDVRN